MNPETFLNGRVRLHHGDSREVLRAIPDASIDSVVTDPPYALVSIVKRFGSASAAPASGDDAYQRASAGFMGQTWDTGETAFASEFWAEVLRVLKPGGYVVAASGTRTYHRLAVAIEDAGFEIRDMVSWLYGAGFPKSHNVGKGIDASLIAGSARTTDMRKIAMGEGYEPSGRGRVNFDHGGGSATNGATSGKLQTDAARAWEGWGTALKPACEPWVLARKPLRDVDTNVLKNVESELRQRGVVGEIKWKRAPANGAAKSNNPPISSSTEAQSAAGTSAASAEESAMQIAAPPIPSSSEAHSSDGLTLTPAATASCPAPMTNGSDTPSCPLMAGAANAAASAKNASSLSTTSMAGEPRTESERTGRSTANSGAKAIRPATESFAGIATGLTGSLAHVHIERAADGSFVWPKSLPEYVTGMPLTVAANVLKHGTGALNIDGARIPMGAEVVRTVQGGKAGGGFDIGSSDGTRATAFESHDKGRWPANVIHDGSEEVTRLFPERDGATSNGSKAGGGLAGTSTFAIHAREQVPGYADSGSAARFFYSAKADADDRLGSKHPTVKPVDLMQYLVRLITPKGGVTLDPFAGTGTTGEAAWREGMSAILIEREPAYANDIRRRLTLAAAGPDERKRESLKANGKAQSHEDLPLFGEVT